MLEYSSRDGEARLESEVFSLRMMGWKKTREKIRMIKAIVSYRYPQDT